jgi:hypothetical protein
MTNFIPYTVGKTYNPEHLRPFDLALATAGHPLAWYDGSGISHFFDGNQEVVTIRVWEKEFWSCIRINKCFLKNLRLAPLAVKDGRPLHVGDVIEMAKLDEYLPNGLEFAEWSFEKIEPLHIAAITREKEWRANWRWPVEVKS